MTSKLPDHIKRDHPERLANGITGGRRLRGALSEFAVVILKAFVIISAAFVLVWLYSTGRL